MFGIARESECIDRKECLICLGQRTRMIEGKEENNQNRGDGEGLKYLNVSRVGFPKQTSATIQALESPQY